MEETIEGAGRVGAQLRTGLAAVKEQVGSTAQTVRDEFTNTARVAKEEARAALGAGVERVRTAADDAVERANGVIGTARSGFQARPEKWLLIAMGAGVLLGACTQMMMIRHKRSEY
jgi:ElaB/YqjD/DUF883 family membrane-anchored ribosome-binding protein